MIIWRLFVLLMLLTLIRYVWARLFYSKGEERSTRGPARRAITGRMVKDPQCGMYVASELAIEARTPDGSVFFCSKECRDSYVRQIERRG